MMKPISQEPEAICIRGRDGRPVMKIGFLGTGSHGGKSVDLYGVAVWSDAPQRWDCTIMGERFPHETGAPLAPVPVVTVEVEFQYANGETELVTLTRDLAMMSRIVRARGQGPEHGRAVFVLVPGAPFERRVYREMTVAS